MKTYFSAADFQPFISRAQFERNLLISALFHGDLVIPEVFLFSRGWLADAVLTDASLPVELLKSGIMEIRFRSEHSGSFLSSLRELKDLGIIGLHEKIDVIAETLERAVSNEVSFQYGMWNRVGGASFYRVVHEFLQQESPAINTPEIQQLWERVRPWRIDAVEEARSRVVDRTLRRGELVNVIGRQLGWKEARNIGHHDELLNFLPDQDPRKADLTQFLTWLAQCYWKNQAEMFGADQMYCETDGYDQLGPYSFASAESGPSNQNQEAFTQVALMPGIQSLLSIDPKEVILIRQSDEGREYVEALQRWKQGDQRITTEELILLLNKYVSFMRQRFLKIHFGDNGALEVWLGRNVGNKSLFLLGTALGIAGMTFPYGEAISTSVFLVGTAWGIYKYFKPAHRELDSLLLARRPEEIVLTRNPRTTSSRINIGLG